MNTIQKCKHGLMVFNRKDSYVGKCLDNYGEFLENQIELLKNFIKEDSVIYDIGANIGSLTLALARLVPKGSVFAFEPERHSFYSLCGNVAINNLQNIYCYPYAIGKSSGTIFVPELDHEQMSDHGWIDLTEKYNCNGYNAVITTIDSIKSKCCNILKINCCGMEIDALQGGLETINANKPYIILNNNPKNNSNALIEMVKSLNYKTYFVRKEFYNQDNFYENKNNLFLTTNYDNLFCFHNEFKINPEIIKKFDLVAV